MHSDESYAQIRLWSEQSLLLLRELLPEMAPIGQYAGWTSAERETIAHIFCACARASESALLLLAYGQLWDAEVVVRSVAEGALKVCYLLQHEEFFKQRHQEYAIDLFEIGLLKKHRKADELLSVLGYPQDKEWRPIWDMILDSDAVERISREYPRATRASLEGRWGFTGLLNELKRSGDPLFNNVAALAYGYSIASHVQHADAIGVSLPFDREKRSNERGKPMQLAHAARLISDVFTYFYVRMAVSYRFLKFDAKILDHVRIRIEDFEKCFNGYYGDWVGVEYPE